MPFSNGLLALPVTQARCQPRTASTASRNGSAWRPGQTFSGSLIRWDECQGYAHSAAGRSAPHCRCRDGGAQHHSQRHSLMCAASAGGRHACTSSSSSISNPAIVTTASQELVSRLSAPSAVQCSTDVRQMATAAQSTDTAPDVKTAPGPPALNGSGPCPADAGADSRSPAAAGSSSSRSLWKSSERPAQQDEQPPESGVLAHSQFGDVLSGSRGHKQSRAITTDASLAAQSTGRAKAKALFQPAEQSQIRDSWRKIMRWSKVGSASCHVLQCKSHLQRNPHGMSTHAPAAK